MHFCTECGSDLAATNADLDAPESVSQYSDILKDFLVDTRLEDWEEEELSKLRLEMGITKETHDNLLSQLGGSISEMAPVRVFVDE